ncbi:MAG: tetratricopeptide repeat protein [Melioribacteraceae bacterium]|nr:tetratricopeptide repeat protein [Melioribacteraceae bacterium]MCF8263852.1 tetratricopeptide repeat protein [Melioribacteraceae bacterium]MCF8414515.1 tetratricopeptide repeat protein [Melioribacteraceae bacterium]
MIKFTKIYIVAILILFSINTFAIQVEDVMNKANSSYQDKDFETAISLYQQILDDGFVSDAVYFNIGNCYFRQGEIGRAILNYERALKLNPGDEDIVYNLNLAKARTTDKITEVPQIFIVQWWEILLTFISVQTWALLLVISISLFSLSLAIYFTSRSSKLVRGFFALGSILFLLIVFSTIFLSSSIHRSNTYSEGVLLEKSISVKSSPDEESGDVFVLHEGIKFKVEDSLQNWVKIKLSDGKVGWLPKSSFEFI